MRRHNVPRMTVGLATVTAWVGSADGTSANGAHQWPEPQCPSMTYARAPALPSADRLPARLAL